LIFGVDTQNLFKIKIMSPAEVAQWQNRQLILPRSSSCSASFGNWYYKTF
jgi:hypothetical protein